MTFLIVGAGLTGATLAQHLASAGERVLVIDRHDHIAGSAHDFIDETGILAHRYGAHIFHTKSEKVWRYLSRFTTFRPYEHRVQGFFSNAVWESVRFPVPFNFSALDDFYFDTDDVLKTLLRERYGDGTRVPILRLLEDKHPKVAAIASFVREMVYLGYTRKQWGCEPEELGTAAIARVPVVMGYDDRYFDTPYQGMPDKGYTDMVGNMLAHPNITVELRTPYDRGYFKGMRTVHTGSIDEFFAYEFGALPFRTMRFETYQGKLPAAVVNYCSEDVPYIRDIDFPAMTGQERVSDTIYREYPLAHEPGRTEPHYPVPTERNNQLHTLYRKEADKLGITFCGRLGDYRYYNMDQAVARAMTVFDDLKMKAAA